ncbi:transposase [Geminicoccus sp.]|uniref:transposase n=1 Tax=Geminicoccus sp. TaxID=2024832 RepID=UPI0032C22525
MIRCPKDRWPAGRPGALAAFAGLLPSEHSSGSFVRRPGRISRVGNECLRSRL